MKKNDIIREDLIESYQILNEFISDETNFEKMYLASQILVEAFQSGKKVISCGNGGSMCDAMHFAEELSGKFRKNRRSLPAIAISDPSHITCTANDFGFNEVFSRFVSAFGNEGDVLLAISTSGNSANVVNAAKSAHEKMMKVISLTGNNGGNLANFSDILIKTPYAAYSDRVQEIHIKIIHSLIHSIELQMNF